MRTLEQQIRSTKFALTRKGYDAASVDRALESFADEVALLLSDLRKESIRVSALERSLTFAEGGRRSPQRELASLVLEATEHREDLLNEAHVAAAAIISAAEVQVERETPKAEGPATSVDPAAPDQSVRLALEEAEAIESAARDLAEQIRMDAEADAARLMESARSAVERLEPVDTGTGAAGVELAQQYG